MSDAKGSSPPAPADAPARPEIISSPSKLAGEENDAEKKQFPKSPKKIAIGTAPKSDHKRRSCDANFVPVARAVRVCPQIRKTFCHPPVATLRQIDAQEPRKRGSTAEKGIQARRIARSSIRFPDAISESPWVKASISSFDTEVYQFCNSGPAAYLSDVLRIEKFESVDNIGAKLMRPCLIIVPKEGDSSVSFQCLTDYLKETNQVALITVRRLENTACLVNDSAPTFSRRRNERLFLTLPSAAMDELPPAITIHANPCVIGFWVSP